MECKLSPQSNTVEAIQNNFFFAKAAIASLEGENPINKAIKTTGIAFASAAIGLANIPITVVKDVTKPDSLFGGFVRETCGNFKRALKSDLSFEEKTNIVFVGGIIYCIAAPIVLGLSLINDPLKGSNL